MTAPSPEERTVAIAAVLREAAELHHSTYRIVEGDDPDWASWYADWLIRLSELPEFIGATPVRSLLVYELVRLDREYAVTQPAESWATFYARSLLSTFAVQSS